MTYSVYCKPKTDFNMSDLDIHMLKTRIGINSHWDIIDEGASQESMIELISYDMSFYNQYMYYYIVLPDVSEGDTVINIKSKDVGKVVNIDNATTKLYDWLINIIDDKEADRLTFEAYNECIDVRLVNGNIARWSVHDCICVDHIYSTNGYKLLTGV